MSGICRADTCSVSHTFDHNAVTWLRSPAENLILGLWSSSSSVKPNLPLHLRRKLPAPLNPVTFDSEGPSHLWENPSFCPGKLFLQSCIIPSGSCYRLPPPTCLSVAEMRMEPHVMFFLLLTQKSGNWALVNEVPKH